MSMLLPREDVAMTYDFSPLFRSSIGFDRIFDLLENAARLPQADNWPPYDIVKAAEDRYAITMAVAGFSPEELSVPKADSEPRQIEQGKRAAQDLDRAEPVRREQDDLGPPSVLLRGVAVTNDRLQPAAVLRFERDRYPGAHAPDSHALDPAVIPLPPPEVCNLLLAISFRIDAVGTTEIASLQSSMIRSAT
jgi:hypothetical protein